MDREEMVELILDLFGQACFHMEKYDHMCLSTYEKAQAFLIEEGKIKPEECYRD